MVLNDLFDVTADMQAIASHCKPFGVGIHGCKTLSCTVAMGHDEPEKSYLPRGTGLKETWLQDVSGCFGQDCICT